MFFFALLKISCMLSTFYLTIAGIWKLFEIRPFAFCQHLIMIREFFLLLVIILFDKLKKLLFEVVYKFLNSDKIIQINFFHYKRTESCKRDCSTSMAESVLYSMNLKLFSHRFLKMTKKVRLNENVALLYVFSRNYFIVFAKMW